MENDKNEKPSAIDQGEKPEKTQRQFAERTGDQADNEELRNLWKKFIYD